ncbi:flavin reductase family protein [Kribbella sancticallisti]
MKRIVEPKVLYFGTPVVIISSCNPDGSTNLGPMSSAWWLDYTAMLGMSGTSQTVRNLTERSDCVLNLVDPAMVAALDRIALLTGCREMSEGKRARGYRYEPDKFAAGGLTRAPADLVDVDAVRESPINLEGRVVAIYKLGGPDSNLCSLEVTVLRVHVREDLLMNDDRYFAGGAPAHESSLARGCQKLDADGMQLHRKAVSATHAGLGHFGVEFQRTFSSNTLRGAHRDSRSS